MKFHFSKFLLLAFMGVFTAVFPMEAPLLKTKPISNDHFKILNLPDELQAKVANFVITGKTIEEATKNIRALAHADPQFLRLINDERVTQGLIKLLQQRFYPSSNDSDVWRNAAAIKVAIALRTTGAGRWLADKYITDSGRIDLSFNDAIEKNDIGRVKFLLHFIPGIAKSKRFNYVHKAIEAWDNPGILELLLINGADPNHAMGEYKETPLLAVLAKENVPDEAKLLRTKLLLKAGANPNIKNAFHFTPLLLAVMSNSRALVELLLNAGADMEVISSDATPLVQAIQHGFTDVVRLLLESGAQVNFAPRRGITPLMIAARQGNVEIMELLLTFGANSNARSDLDYTPLIYAIHANRNRIAAVRLLLENGADLMARNKLGRTALESAESMDPHEDKQRIIELLKNPPALKKIRKLQ